MQLRSLTYTSLAGLDLTARDLDAIHSAARRINPLDGITGLLIFNGVRFLQIVEGSEAALDALLSRLRRDHRHSGIEIRDVHPIDRRAFPEWSMELVQVSSDGFVAHEEISAVLPSELPPAVREHVLNMTESIGQVVTLPD